MLESNLSDQVLLFPHCLLYLHLLSEKLITSEVPIIENPDLVTALHFGVANVSSF